MTTRAREVEALRELEAWLQKQIDAADMIPVAVECWLQSLSALIAECEWRDIASAPKDGTPFLAAHDPQRFYPVSMWVTWWAKAIEGFTDGNGHCLQAGDYTHWRPLPDPPQPIGEEKGETK